jgi:hypothetical protein
MELREDTLSIQSATFFCLAASSAPGFWRWACTVGPTYIKKAGKSWGVRIRKNWKSQLPLWLLWSFLPKTLLLRVAALAGKDAARKDAMACVNKIARLV